TFSVTNGDGARGLRGMLPNLGNGQAVTSLTRDGAPVELVTRTVKGIEYAFFSATPGNYVATFAQGPTRLVDDIVAEFSAGTPGANTRVSNEAGGEVILAPTLHQEFDGAALPSGWTASPWETGGSATVGGGAVVIDAARLAPDQFF